MKIKQTILIVLAFICAQQTALSQNLSNRGKDFWVGYGHHQFMESGQSNSQEMVLYLSAEQAANVTVTIDGTTYVRNYAVPANSVIATEYLPKSGATDARLISLPCTFVPPGFPCGGEGVFTGKGIHIVSDVPIVAYAHIFGSASSGASMLMPTETWGYSYVTLNSKQVYAANCFSWTYVIAQRNNTVIEVTPSQVTRTGKPANVPYQVTLNRGEIYQVMAGPESGTTKPEMTGTKIKSIANSLGECYPIAVFAGSSRTSNPQTCGSGGGDNDNQQCFPSQAWGKRYLTAPTSNSNTPSSPMWNAYKIAVKDPGTVVTRNGTTLTPLANGTYYFESNTADYIESNKPIMVAQFMTGGSTCQGGGGVGDPEMMYISPIEQGIKRIGFYRNTREGITVNYLTMIIPSAGMTSLTINGSATFDHSYDHPQLPGYKVVIKRWPAAQAQAVAQSDYAFTAITYGLGSVESYGYNAGTLINNLNAVGSIFNSSDTSTTTTSHPFTCNNTPVKLSVYIAYQPTKLVWQLSQVGAVLSPNADVTDNAPVSTGSTVINGVTYYKYSLPGTYNFSATGAYTIPLLSTHPSIENCNNTEGLSFIVTVNGKPSIDFSYTHSGCVLDTVQFNGPATALNSFAINQWLWTYPDATTNNIKDPRKLFLTPGVHNVRLQVVSAEGCVGDTIKPITIYAKPLATINANPVNLCQGGTVALSSTGSYGGPASLNKYYWDFGNSTTVTLGANTPQTASYPNYGNYMVKHVVGVSATCYSDTAYQPIRVYSKPTTTFTYPAGCLPASGIVQFTSNATTPDGQAIIGHSWNFGDPNANAGNPNTSTAANPTHMYSTFGNYTITYSVTTANGCTKDTTVNATFNMRPTFNYPALAPVCQSSAGTVNVATATVTNGVTGTGTYNGPGTSPSGQFNPAVAGPGTHTIWYVFAATSGCTDSVSQTITVAAKPNSSFSYSPNACLPASGQVQFTYNGSVSAGQTYLWNFGDPNANAGNPNTSTAQNPTHNYSNTGTYTISLTVTDASGCFDDTVMVRTLSVTPTLNYPALAPVCQSVTGTVSVATATVTNGVTGSGTYSGPGTDAAGNFNPSVAGPGTHTITYTFTSTGGCIATLTSTITVNPKPNASFSIPSGCLPANGFVQFTYNGSVGAGQTYLWNFGDPNANAGNPNTSTAQNPTHNYSVAGNYVITVTATNSAGCTDDSTFNATLNLIPALNYPALPAVCQSVTGTVSVATATVTNGVTGTGVYSGPGTDAAGNFNPSVAGAGTHTITYTFTGTGSCTASTTQTVTVTPKPAASFAYAPNACLPTNGQVQFTYNGSVSAGQTYLWNFGDPNANAGNPNTSTAQSPTHNYTNTGSYTISLSVTSASGCTDDTTIVRTLSVTPELSWAALTSVCQGTAPVSIATASVINGVTGTGVYSGPGTNASGQFDPNAAGAGTHTITYTFTSSGGCIASTSQTITVNAKPNASFSFTNAACLPTNGLVQFTYNGTTSAGQTYLWNFGDPNANAGNPNTSTAQNPTHNYTNTGNYTITVTATNTAGCSDDSVIVRTLSVQPALSWAPLSSRCQGVAPASIATATVTNNVTGTGVYSGPGTNASGMFDPTAAGPGTHTITYTFTSSGGCVETTTQTVTVNPKPNASFTFTNAACLPTNGQVQFTYNGTAATSYLWNFGDPNANAGNPNTSTLPNPTHNYTNTGTYNITLTASNSFGCTDDSVIVRTLSVQPALSWGALTGRCQGAAPASIATATVTNNVTGTGVYSGPGTSSAGIFDPNAAGPGTHTITYTFTSTGGCVETTTQTVTVNPKPNASFTYTNAACLPTTGQVQFTYNGTAATAYLWNFGDPNANAGNPNTSTLPNPTHNYTNTGTYNITLTATNSFGCTDDSVMVRAFSVQPALSWSALTGRCAGTAPSSIATATVTNNVTGTGVYSGPGTSAAGIFDPTAAGPGSHTITYTFTSTGGCVETTTQSVTVNPKPASAFAVTTEICTNEPAEITPNVTIPTGSITSWRWTFGDLSSETRTNNTAFTHPYASYGNYEIKLVAVSDKGCISDTARQPVSVHAVPVANFSLPTSVCMPDALDIRNASTVADNSGLTYQWDFDDAGPGSTAANPSHTYATSGSYDIKLTVTSQYGCVKDTTRTFASFFDKPLADFRVDNNSICQGVPTVFDNLSSAPNSSIRSQLWIFSDGSNSTQFEPNKVFTRAGVYEIKLVVTSNEGCVSDTFPQTVTVNVQPVIDAGQSFLVPQGTLIQFRPTANDSTVVSFVWSPGGSLSNPNTLRPTLVATTDQVYTLTATGPGNCTATDFMTVKVVKPVKIPNAFSPNGDGVNDTWVIENLSDYPGAAVDIFNRYGQPIYSSVAGYPVPWDGTMKGKPLPLATYYYIINLKNGTPPLSGPITLIR
jgi:gliding motility-associated-like protein